MLVNLTQFNGVNNIVHPAKLPPQLAQEFTNIDTHNYTLKSVQEPYTDGAMTLCDGMNIIGDGDKYFYKRGDLSGFASYPLSVEYLNGYLYNTSKGVDPTSRLYRVNPDGTEHLVGVDAPTNPITLSQSGAYYREAGFYYAYFYYAITFYDDESGEESEPILSSVIQAEKVNIHIEFDASEIDTSHTKYINIYRVGGMIDKFSLVDSIDVSGYDAAALAAFSYDDDKADTALTKLLTTRGTIVPPTGLCNLIYHNGRFYGSVGSRLRFSPFGNANRWDALAYIDFESDIYALASVNGMLVVMLETKTFVLYGDDTYNYKLLSLTGDIGCTEPNSVAYFRNVVVWYTYNGLVCSDGNSVNYLTRDIYDFPAGTTFRDAIAFQDKYYAMSNAGVLYELDMAEGVKFRMWSASTHSDMYGLYTCDNKLYSISSATNPSKWYELFPTEYGSSAETSMNIEYTSRLFTGPDYAYPIELKKVVLTCNGDFVLTIYDQDEDEVEAFTIDTNGDTWIHDMYLPVDTNTLKGFYFKIIGVGEITDITLDIYYPETYNVRQQ